MKQVVRSIRRGLEPGTPDELRDSALDPLIAESGGRISMAAPYFRYSSDHVLRDWQLLDFRHQRALREKIDSNHLPGRDAGVGRQPQVVDAGIDLAEIERLKNHDPASRQREMIMQNLGIDAID